MLSAGYFASLANNSPETTCVALNNALESDQGSTKFPVGKAKSVITSSFERIPTHVPTNFPTKVNPWWIVGMTDGEGCFSVDINKNSTTRQGVAVQLNFNITQLGTNRIVLDALVEYFDCGHVVINNRTNGTFMYRVRDLHHLTSKILPFFDKYPLVGCKHLEFVDFCKVAELMKAKAHQTPSGLAQIQLIKAGMNRGRTPT